MSRMQPEQIMAVAAYNYGRQPGEVPWMKLQPAQREFKIGQARAVIEALADAHFAITDAHPHGDHCRVQEQQT
jgi:hypothetical protein